MCEMFGQFIQQKHEEKQAANARYWKIPACCYDDDDYNFAITPNEPVDSLSMGDEHLNTIPATESEEFIKSCVRNKKITTYSQWVERFMNYLKEQTDEEAMINSIKNGDQPLPRVTQVSIAGTTSTEQPILKDKSMWSDQEKRTNVSRSKEKVVVSSDSKGSKADDFNDKKVEKKVDEKKRDMSRVKCYNYKKERHFAKDCNKAKVQDYEYYKTKMLLAKKDKDEQVLLAEDQAWMESSSDSDQEINANMVFMAQIEKVISDSEASSSSANEKISKVSYYLSDAESESEFETSEYYDNSTNYGLFVNN
nr:hypothetical protein [Tanacetum cinerariifolium]